MKEVPVLLLTGYLGSGKTTLLNHILQNERGIRFAVIVNDIGEVNIDASLIKKGGIVGADATAGDLVALQNGCICCTLKMDLVEQLADIIRTGEFDYIVIEASGICEPEPIAQTICSIPRMEPKYSAHGIPRLAGIVTVVDALRMQSEFGCGEELRRENLEEEDIENLIIQQIEFCNIIVLNKISEVTPAEAAHIREIIRALQPKAELIECDYADVDPLELLKPRFNYAEVATSATWVQKIEEEAPEEEEHHHDGHHDHEDGEHEHGHHHHHHHHDEEGEAEEYGIGTMVYYRRKPFDINKFDYFVAKSWPKNIIRAKGVVYFKHDTDMSYLFEQAGVQKKLTAAGLWYATAPAEELEQLRRSDPNFDRDWDETYGDRMIKLVIIGRNLDKEGITRSLDGCLA